MKGSYLINLVLIVLLSVLIAPATIAQEKEKKDRKKRRTMGVYQVNRKVEIPVTVGLFIIHQFGFDYIYDKPRLTEEEIAQLDPNDICKFDRRATQQEVSFMNTAHEYSDYALNASVILPFFLAFDKNIRKDWLDLLILYTETHAINTSVYMITAGFVDRKRPFVYNEGVSMDMKTGEGTKVSFYSGHVSTAASATFFMAKVYSDYHQEIGNKKYWLYGAALIPPIIVGYYRYRAMRHFPTDVITGMVVGATMGILIPELHRNKKKKSDFSFMPFVGHYNGLRMTYSIR